MSTLEPQNQAKTVHGETNLTKQKASDASHFVDAVEKKLESTHEPSLAQQAKDSYQGTPDIVSEKLQQGKEKAEEAVEQVKPVLEQAKDQVMMAAEKVKPVLDRAKTQMQVVAEKAKPVLDRAKTQVQVAAEQAKPYLDQAKTQVQAAAEQAKPYLDQAKTQVQAAAEQAKPYLDQAKTQVQAAAEQAKPYLEQAAVKAKELYVENMPEALGGKPTEGMQENLEVKETEELPVENQDNQSLLDKIKHGYRETMPEALGGRPETVTEILKEKLDNLKLNTQEHETLELATEQSKARSEQAQKEIRSNIVQTRIKQLESTS